MEDDYSACCLPTNGLQQSCGGGERFRNQRTFKNNNNKKSAVASTSFIDDAIITKELNELSFAEREKAMDDLHGVSQMQKETPEFIESCIKAMDEVLDNIPVRKKRAYIRAVFLWPALKTDSKNDDAKRFKLRFLRADSYNGQKAATRLIRYYEEKRKLFGEAKLVKTITMDDLNEDDLKEFTSGGTLTLPIKDQSGRPIVYWDVMPEDNWDTPLESTARALWYHTMTVFDEDDEVAQIKGAVGISRMSGISTGDVLSPKWIREQLELNARVGDVIESALPGRFSSFHLCIDDPNLGVLVSSARLAVRKFTRLRLRVHTGSDLENEYSLMSFGIPIDGVLEKTRKGCTDLHMKYIQRRREIDRQKMEIEFQECLKTGFVPFPTQSDVLFGRGKPYRDFPGGNEEWNQIIADHCDRFRKGNSRFEKTCVTIDVVKKVRDCSKIRFLLESSSSSSTEAGGWKMIRDEECLREKASAALQNRVKTLSRSMKSSRDDEIMRSDDENVAKRRRYEGDEE